MNNDFNTKLFFFNSNINKNSEIEDQPIDELFKLRNEDFLYHGFWDF